MSEPQQSQEPKSPGPQGVVPEMHASGVAPLARTASTVLRGAPCWHAFRTATRPAGDYEIGSYFAAYDGESLSAIVVPNFVPDVRPPNYDT